MLVIIFLENGPPFEVPAKARYMTNHDIPHLTSYYNLPLKPPSVRLICDSELDGLYTPFQVLFLNDFSL